jgi:hypothetical protein
MIDDFLTDGLSVTMVTNKFIKFLENPNEQTLNVLRQTLNNVLEKMRGDQVDFIIDLVIDVLEFYHLVDKWKKGKK